MPQVPGYGCDFDAFQQGIEDTEVACCGAEECPGGTPSTCTIGCAMVFPPFCKTDGQNRQLLPITPASSSGSSGSSGIGKQYRHDHRHLPHTIPRHSTLTRSATFASDSTCADLIRRILDDDSNGTQQIAKFDTLAASCGQRMNIGDALQVALPFTVLVHCPCSLSFPSFTACHRGSAACRSSRPTGPTTRETHSLTPHTS